MGKTIGGMGKVNTLPKGEYKLRCQDILVKPSSKGNLQIEWNVMELESGAELKFFSSLHPNAQNITKAWLLAFGCDEADVMPEDEAGWNQYLRRVCRGKVAVAQLDIEEKPSTRAGAKPDEKFKVNIVSPPWEIYPVTEAAKEKKPEWMG